MIPTIGLIIAGYALMRALEVLATLDRIANKSNRAVVTIVAVAVVLISVFGAIDLVVSEQKATTVLAPFLR